MAYSLHYVLKVKTLGVDYANPKTDKERNVHLPLTNLYCLQQLRQARLKTIVREQKANTYNKFNADDRYHR